VIQDNTFNVTLMHVLATIVAVVKQYVLHIVSVGVVVVAQHAVRMRHTVICGLHRCTTLFHLKS
jgi:hypothetical protein